MAHESFRGSRQAAGALHAGRPIRRSLIARRCVAGCPTHGGADPDGDDLAIVYLGLDYHLPFKVGYVHEADFLSEEHVHGANVGAGDDCFMVGRFITHQGQQQNTPAVRFGNISMMPGEPIWQDARRFGQVAYLVEMRSLSGYSGSPVFWQRPRGTTSYQRKCLGVDSSMT
jgi:hypothetical protein